MKVVNAKFLGSKKKIRAAQKEIKRIIQEEKDAKKKRKLIVEETNEPNS